MLAAVPFLALTGAAFAATPAARVPEPSQMAHHRTTNSVEARRETRALNLIEAKGFGDFRDFHADGKNFQAQVTSASKSFNVVVDPDTGQVTRQG